MKAGIEWCAALLWFPFFCLVLKFNSPTISTYEAGIGDVLLFCDSFLCVWSWVFSTVLPNFYLWSRDWVMCCSFVIPFFTFGLRVFSTVLPNFYLWKQGLSDVLLFCDSLRFGLKSIFQQSYNFHLWKQGLSDVLLFVIPFFVFGQSIFQQSYNSYLWKQGLSDVLLFCDSFLCLVLRVFFNSPTVSTYESRDWVMCCSFVIPFFTFGLKSIFQQSTIPTKQELVMCCSFVIPFFVFGLRVFSTVLPNFYL
jgi:hypothetical protein